MAGFGSALVNGGGCGDGFGPGTTVTKFANTFLGGQNSRSEYSRGELIGGVGGFEDGSSTLAETGVDQLAPFFQEQQMGGAPVPSVLASQNFEAEFLQEFLQQPQEGIGEGGMLLFNQNNNQHQNIGGGVGSMVNYMCEIFGNALSNLAGAIVVPQLPLLAAPNTLSHPEKVGVVKQLNLVLESHHIADQSLFDMFLHEGLRAFSIEPSVLEQVALETEWEQVVQQQNAVVQPSHATFENEWIVSQNQQQQIQQQQIVLHQNNMLAFEQEFQQHFSLQGQQSAQWQQQFEEQQQQQGNNATEQQVFEEEFKLAQQQNVEQWIDQFQEQFETEEQRMRKEEAEWFAQFVPQGPASAQAASWIDEFLTTPDTNPSSSLVQEFLEQPHPLPSTNSLIQEFLDGQHQPSPPSNFHNDVRNAAGHIATQIPHSELIKFLNGVANSQVNVDALSPEQSFFPS